MFDIRACEAPAAVGTGIWDGEQAEPSPAPPAALSEEVAAHGVSDTVGRGMYFVGSYVVRTSACPSQAWSH